MYKKSKLILLSVAVLFSAGLLAFILKNGDPRSSWAELTLSIRIAVDYPVCLLEESQFIEVKRAHFAPMTGSTINVRRCRVKDAPLLTGAALPADVVVVSGFGGVVQRISAKGVEVWRKSLKQPRGLSLDASHVYVGNGKEILVLDLGSGKILARIKLPEYVAGIAKHGDLLAVAFAINNQNAIRLYRLTGFNIQEVKRINDAMAYPRGLDFDSKSIVVADTYGHRIVSYDIRTLKQEWVAESFFPNSIHFLRDRQVVVAEEHLNQVSTFDDKGRRTGKVVACSSVQDIPDVLQARIAANKPGLSGDSPCRVTKNQVGGIFSPNDAFLAGKFTYVADTDNHRILVFVDGSLASTVQGFNDPVNIMPIGL